MSVRIRAAKSRRMPPCGRQVLRAAFCAAALSAASCTHAPPKTTVVAQVPAGRDAVVRISVPESWRPMAPSASRVELVGPDRRSRVYLRALPAAKDPARCATLTRQTAEDAISSWGSPPYTQATAKVFGEDQAEFELRRVDPKPFGEVIWYRVICRSAAIAIASCAALQPRESAMKPICREILDSVEVAPRAAGEPGATNP